ncbi:hypothetical protein [Achromobacter xylosoxidans]|uniref:hypothetical protein n=1 Tax=Alcaligenes xylosoxydans xylosoxydans TaxID=85698 RepID=UPI00047B164E|nr:hypothetical protein [Achromobacter xylosoxidans]
MTQQDDITQRVLTDDEIMRSAISACDSLNITRFHEIGAPSKTIMDDAGLLELGRAIESTVLSQVRAPVAEQAALFEQSTTKDDKAALGILECGKPLCAPGDHHPLCRHGCAEKKGASAPTPKPWPVEEQPDGTVTPVDPVDQASAPVADKPAFYINPEVIDHETGDLAAHVDRAITWSREETRAWSLPVYLKPRQASAPVAGEAKNYPGDNVAERLDKMADGQPPGSQAQSDLYAAATIWRKHIAHRAAPQASAVAGEAVYTLRVRGAIQAWTPTAAAFSIPDGEHQLFLSPAAPQASEAVRTHVLAALESAQRFIRNGIEFGYIRMPDADTPDPAHRTPGLIDAAIRSLKSQADKDGGQQRAGDGKEPR